VVVESRPCRTCRTYFESEHRHARFCSVECCRNYPWPKDLKYYVRQKANGFTKVALWEELETDDVAKPGNGGAIAPMVVQPADMSFRDYSGMSFGRWDLRMANMTGSDFSNCSFRKADLRGADLEGASLRNANLEYAWLHAASLKNADLRGADLGCANLLHADLTGANLEGAHMGGAITTLAVGL